MVRDGRGPHKRPANPPVLSRNRRAAVNNLGLDDFYFYGIPVISSFANVIDWVGILTRWEDPEVRKVGMTVFLAGYGIAAERTGQLDQAVKTLGLIRGALCDLAVRYLDSFGKPKGVQIRRFRELIAARASVDVRYRTHAARLAESNLMVASPRAPGRPKKRAVRRRKKRPRAKRTAKVVCPHCDKQFFLRLTGPAEKVTMRIEGESVTLVCLHCGNKVKVKE